METFILQGRTCLGLAGSKLWSVPSCACAPRLFALRRATPTGATPLRATRRAAPSLTPCEPRPLATPSRHAPEREAAWAGAELEFGGCGRPLPELQGGYNPQPSAPSVASSLRALAGAPRPGFREPQTRSRLRGCLCGTAW